MAYHKNFFMITTYISQHIMIEFIRIGDRSATRLLLRGPIATYNGVMYEAEKNTIWYSNPLSE